MSGIEPVFAFFDEFGEEGFGRKASEYFVLAASVQRGIEFKTVRQC